MGVYVALVLRARSFDDVPPPSLTSIAPIKVARPNGRVATIGSLLRPGVPTIISLWASWCGPCRMEAPTIASLQERAARGEINLLYLNVRDAASTRDDLNAALEAMQLRPDSYAVLPDDAIKRVTRASSIAIPHTLLFDRDGHGDVSITGYAPLALERMIARIDR